MRRIAWGGLLVIVAVWIVSVVSVALAARHDGAVPADAIVVLGAAQYNGRPSPVLKARLDHAAGLFHRQLAPRVVVTGGVGAGDSVSEAEVGRRYLLETAGLPDSAVASENAGRTSEASLRALARDSAAAGKRVILVSDGFHMLRLGIIARRMGFEAVGSPAPGSPIRASWRRELPYILGESVKAPVAFIVTRTE